jgi:ubiquinone/menaquinone biosynthesis C-methylase UbiE
MQHTAHHTAPRDGSLPISRQNFVHPAQNVAALGITEGMKIADFGAGSGAYTFALAQALANSGHLYAIDVQRDLLARIHNESRRRGFSNVKIIWADLEKKNASKIASRALDLVLISNLLFQIENKTTVIAEAHRILAPNGRLVVIDWIDSYHNMGPRKEDIVPKDQIFSICGALGFDSMKKFSPGPHHWGILAQTAGI